MFIDNQTIARTLGRVGYVLFIASQKYKLRLPHHTYPPFYYQLAASTWHKGKGDKVMARFVAFDFDSRGRPQCYWRLATLGVILDLPATLPVTIVWGENDGLLPSSFGNLIADIRPNTRLFVIDQAAHNPVHSSADLFCDVLMTQVLARVSGGACTFTYAHTYTCMP